MRAEIKTLQVSRLDDFEEAVNKELEEGWAYVESFDRRLGESRTVILQKVDFSFSAPRAGNPPLELLQEENQTLTETIAKLQRELSERDLLIKDMVNKPIEMFLKCPNCGEVHIDRNEWASKPHRTHRCETCETEWRPCNSYTVGVSAQTLIRKGDTTTIVLTGQHKDGAGITIKGPIHVVGQGIIGDSEKVKT